MTGSSGSKRSADQPAEKPTKKSSAGQPAKSEYLSLQELNKQSAKTGSGWLVTVWNPRENHYTYSYGQKQIQGVTFVATLVSAEDASWSVEAHFRKNRGNASKYEETKKAMAAGVKNK